MKKNCLILPLVALAACSGQQQERLPNVIIIMADDLGCGDLSVLGSTVLKTPNIDRIATEGLIFTNGYAAAPTSTPSRYSLMTGMYPWRNSEAEILPGDGNLIIGRDQPTIAKLMKYAGYETGVIGKWHLGLGRGEIDWNAPINPSPKETGFDYSFIIAATNDRVPTVYVEDGTVVGLDMSDPIYVSYTENFSGEPTALTHPEMLRMKWSMGHFYSIVNGIPRIGYMKGGSAARWVDEDMADLFVDKVKGFIDRNRENPFFLYYGLHQPHVPRVPHPRFAGKSDMGHRGDVILEADWCVGEVMKYLEEADLAENTIVIFTSDNGPVLDDGYRDEARERWGGINPAQPYRGGKYSLFDGGCHIPFFVHWKGRVKPGVSDAVVCQIDLYASLAEMVGIEMPHGLDSRSTLGVFLGKSKKGREQLVLGSMGKLSMRSGDWYLMPPCEGFAVDPCGIETGWSDSWALYDLGPDTGQREDVAGKYPEKLEELRTVFSLLTAGY